MKGRCVHDAFADVEKIEDPNRRVEALIKIAEAAIEGARAAIESIRDPRGKMEAFIRIAEVTRDKKDIERARLSVQHMISATEKHINEAFQYIAKCQAWDQRMARINPTNTDYSKEHSDFSAAKRFGCFGCLAGIAGITRREEDIAKARAFIEKFRSVPYYSVRAFMSIATITGSRADIDSAWEIAKEADDDELFAVIINALRDDNA